MPWTFYNSNGQRLSTATTLLDNLDIDGATDIGGAIADADLFIIDDGAGGTNRKTEASRLKTYIDANASGPAKGYASVAANGTLQSNSYNVTSSAKDSTGKYTVTWAEDFGNTNYAVVGTPEESTDSNRKLIIRAVAAGTCNPSLFNNGTDLADEDFHIVAFGDR